MGREDKRYDIVDWFKRIIQDESILTRTFFNIASLHQLYCNTRIEAESELSSSSFLRLVSSIANNGLYENLKVKKYRDEDNNYKRITEYIIFNDDEINVNVEDIVIQKKNR